MTEEYYKIDLTVQMMSRQELEAYALSLKHDNHLLLKALTTAVDVITILKGGN